MQNNASLSNPIALLGRVFTPQEKTKFDEFKLIHKELLEDRDGASHAELSTDERYKLEKAGLELDFQRHYDFFPYKAKHELPGPVAVHSKITYLQLIADVAEKGKS